jgi:hypothetical protein
MSVWRLWLQLTRMVLAGRGGYKTYVYVDDMSAFKHTNFEVVHTTWVGGGDQYLTIAAEQESA